ASRMEPAPQPDMAAVAALPPRTQDELLDAIAYSIYNQPPTDWSKVTNLGKMMAVPEVKETVNLAQQYVQCGDDAQALIALHAQISSRRCMPSSITRRSWKNSTPPGSPGAGCIWSAAPRLRRFPSART